MAGRAGRRGKDTRGIVIQMMDEKMEPDVAKAIMFGKTDPLNSAYHVNYYMLLNMLRVEGAHPEALVRSSFHQFQQEQAAPALANEAAELAATASLIKIEAESGVAEYALVAEQLKVSEAAARAVVVEALTRDPHGFLQIGRLVHVVDGGDDFGWCMVCERPKTQTVETPPPDGAEGEPTTTTVAHVRVLARCAPSPTDAAPPKPPAAEAEAAEAAGGGGGGGGASVATSEMRVMNVLVNAVHSVSKLKLQDAAQRDLRAATERERLGLQIGEAVSRVKKQQGGAIPCLDPKADMRINDPDLDRHSAQAATLRARLAASPIDALPDRDARLGLHAEKTDAEQRARVLKKEARAAQTLVFRDEIRRMRRLLRRLGYATAENVIDLKGRVACEVNTADEIVVTELIFNGAFSALSPEMCAAALSCLVFTERRGDENVKLTKELSAVHEEVKKVARRVGTAKLEAKIVLDLEEYVEGFNEELMPVVLAWANGEKFVDICQRTNQFEGSIIRVIRRLEELLRQLSSAALAVGNQELREKFTAAADLLRRDIVFAASLYL